MLMKYRRKNNKTITIIFLLLVLVIGIGYAYLTSNLSITGATAVTGNTWDIHFANVQVTTGSVTASTPATINLSDNTKINYAVQLEKPGDYYEFTVDMVNAGTLPGKVTLIELNGITSTVEDVIDYSIVYTNKNTPVAVNDILNANYSKNITVRVYYNEDIEEEDLLTSNVNLNLKLDVTFNQAAENEMIIDYLYYTLNSYVSIGQEATDIGTSYATYEEANAAFGKNYFLKRGISNNIIVDSYIGFIIDNQVYYIKGAINESELSNKPTYENNKSIMLEAFGSENCQPEYIFEGNKHLYCNNPFAAEISEDGKVFISGGSYECYVQNTGYSYCDFVS